MHDLVHCNTGASGTPSATVRGDCAVRTGAVITATLRTTTVEAAIIRALASYEPVLGANLPAPLASLLTVLLAVDPAIRPTATAARAAIGSLAAASVQWGS